MLEPEGGPAAVTRAWEGAHAERDNMGKGLGRIHLLPKTTDGVCGDKGPVEEDQVARASREGFPRAATAEQTGVCQACGTALTEVQWEAGGRWSGERRAAS